MGSGFAIPSSEVGPPQSKTVYVVGRLRRDIAAGTIRPGEALRQTEIASRYGVSPTPVREALRILEAAGSIAYSPNRGATVRDMESSDVDDLYRLRAEMEGFACRLSVERHGSSLSIELQSLAEKLEFSDPLHDAAEMYQLNRDFHFHLAGAASRAVLQQIVGVWEAFPPTVTVWGYPEIAEKLNLDHRKIIEATAAGDAKQAQQQMRDHILNARAMRRQLIG